MIEAIVQKLASEIGIPEKTQVTTTPSQEYHLELGRLASSLETYYRLNTKPKESGILQPNDCSAFVDYIIENWFKLSETIVPIDSLKRFNRELTTRNSRRTETLKRDALVDRLTGLYNYRYFQAELRKIVEATDSGVFSLAMIDIDYFKLVNDIYGHQIGNIVHQTLGKTIRDTVENSGNTTARYGGEEFAVILPEKNKNEAHQQLEILRKKVEELDFNGRTANQLDLDGVIKRLDYEGKSEQEKQLAYETIKAKFGIDVPELIERYSYILAMQDLGERLTHISNLKEEIASKLRLTISIGIASFPSDMEIETYQKHRTAADKLLSLADKALYRAKSVGRNCIRYTT